MEDVLFQRLPDQSPLEAQLPQDEQDMVQQLQTHASTKANIHRAACRRGTTPQGRAIVTILAHAGRGPEHLDERGHGLVALFPEDFPRPLTA